MPDRITHRQIEAFRAVMLSASMTDAARMLSVTQPAISKILSTLEQELGFPLFQRRQGGLKPTDEAHALYAEVNRSYSGLDRVARVARNIRDATGGRLRLAVLPTFSNAFLPRVIRRLKQGRGEIGLSIQTYNSEEVVEMVASGLADIGFSMTPIDMTRVRSSAVLRVPSFCLLPPGHRLSQAAQVSVADLAGEPFIATSEGTSSRLRIDALFSTMNVARGPLIEARWSQTIVALVQEGLGVAIIDAFAAQGYARLGGVVKPLAERVDFTFVQVQPASGLTSALAKEFLDTFDDELQRFQLTCAEAMRGGAWPKAPG